MQIQNDKALDIALGNSRKTKKWKNKTMQWSELLDRLANTTRTPETMAEYKAMTRDQQANIKDVGGFVGGYCNKGNRSNIRFRSVLCLDADYADNDLWDDWLWLIGNAAAVYSTHKHTPEKPRLRLVIPLARNVDPDEYQAIGRKVASLLGIDKFDDTTYQPQRLMHFPSTSQDGEFVFDYTDGDFLDPDSILSTYHDWRDMSSWPMSSRVADIVRKSERKQKDPLAKPGLIGAFCRAYSIEEAIEKYVPTYQPCDEPNRYTYTEGSTAAGVVLYDDKFSYSHHATDPASGQLVNAWDLVRIHQFHDLDEDIDPDTTASKRPSYKAMAQLASQDERVKEQLVTDRLAEADADFEVLEDEDDWKTKLDITEKGGISPSIKNVCTILEHDPKLKGCLGFDEMDMIKAVRRDLPWREAGDRRGKCWTDSDNSYLRGYLEKHYGIAQREKTKDAVEMVARNHSFHPVRDYLNSCQWDGTERLDRLFVRYLGAEDTEYVRAVTRKTFVAAVARVFQPGCQFDYLLTLQGGQGIGKSTLMQRLAGDWFSDSLTTMQGKEAYEQLRKVWIVEVAELDGLKRSEITATKQFISKRTDQYRPAYGQEVEIFPRQCIFIGTTNEVEFLRDSTGNRRYWIVGTPNSDDRVDYRTELDEDLVKQVWGEAVHYYKEGERLYLDDRLEAEARKVQDSYMEMDDRTGLVKQYLERKLPEDWDSKDEYERRDWLDSDAEGTVERKKVCRSEIWTEVLGKPKGTLNRYDSREIDAMLKQCGWVYANYSYKFLLYGWQRVYKPPRHK